MRGHAYGALSPHHPLPQLITVCVAHAGPTWPPSFMGATAMQQAELGVEPSAGMLVCTAQALLDAPCSGGGIRGAIGPALKHLVVLMPDAAGDYGTGARVATGEVSLADSPGFLQLLTILGDAYGQHVRPPIGMCACGERERERERENEPR